MHFETVELFTESKTGNGYDNEDVVLDTEDWLVVCDGATDVTGYRYGGHTGGIVAAEVTASAVADMPSGSEAGSILSAVNEAYNAVFGEDLERLGVNRPTCSLLAVDKSAGRVLRVGDVSWSNCLKDYPGYKLLDDCHSHVRAAYLDDLLEEGIDEKHLLEDDPGREIILPSIRKQSLFRNTTDSLFSFGAIDGTEVPEKFIETWNIEEVSQVIVATDGYPVLRYTLELAEAYLKKNIEDDPLRIGTHAGTKGVLPGNVSFDDRTYVRLQRLG